jgi:DNA-binding GntR family transcriptional regulator
MAETNNNVFQITKSLSKPIYDYLKNSIITNEFKANERIHEKEIAKNFGVSRTPVREAIIRLSVEGFVDIDYHRESVVKDIPYEGLEEILHVISCLDAYAITLVADKISAKDIAQIENLTIKMGKYVEIENAQKFFNVNFTLHGMLWNYLPEGFLRSTLEVGAAQIQRYTFNPLISEAQTVAIQKSAYAAHDKIVTALKARDKEKLSHLIGQHWIYPGSTFLSDTHSIDTK